jgi:hypothetical protein
MRLCVILFALFILPVAGFAQFTNNWVSHNQQYYKISVSATGIYRLTFEQMQAAGIPVGTLDPRLIQVFHRGEEQAIFFKHNQQPANGTFESGEYLEFYGERNDGGMDTKMYEPTSAQPHKYYNLYSDESAYFLTVNPLPVQGKRMEAIGEVNSTGIAKETFHNAEQLRVYSNEYSTGDVQDTYVTQSVFDSGEGWTGETICTINNGCVEQRDFIIDQLTNGITSQAAPKLEIQITGRDFLQHAVEIYAGSSAANLRLLSTRQFNNYNTPTYTEALNWSDISVSGGLVVRVKALGVAGLRDRISVAYIKVTFAQGFNLASATSRYFNLNLQGSGKSYIELDNAPASTRLWDITNRSDIATVALHGSGTPINAIVTNTSSARNLYAASGFIVPDVSQIKPVKFRELSPAAKYIIVTHRSLQQPATGYSNPVKAFAEYRASQEGGGYDTLTVNVDELYDQFNYGEVSPVAITEFMKFMVGNGDPQYLFLIGKGRDVFAGLHRRSPIAGELDDLVPPAGYPGSDIPFTAGLKGDPYVQAVATGRLTAVNPQQVADYLNKVKETETTPFDEFWRKSILHLSGGKESSQIVLFRGYMEGFADIARGDYYGATVNTISKRGISEVEPINVSDQINAGVNLVTFLGHSAPNTTDIDIGDVDDPILGYKNAGKYPVFLVNGCNAGEYFNSEENFGENWTMTPNRGARNFIANSSFGFELVLRAYSTYFYQVAFADSAFLAKGVGDVQKEVARRFLNDFGHDKSVYTAQAQQMVLLGDPAMKLFAPAKPDYQTEDALIDVVSFDGKPIHALTDSIELQVITRNFGRSMKRKLTMKILHTINDAVNEYNQDFNHVLFEDTLKFTIRRGAGNFYGSNKIEVFLDPENKIDELDENNNKGQWTRAVNFNGTQNLQPGNFSIVNTKSVDALFQDTDVLSQEKTYNIQFDTTRTFNSSFVQVKTVTGKVLMKTHFDLLDEDSTVYYWRTKPSDKSDDEWSTTSFTYINNGPEGWTQMAFDQLLENKWEDLVVNEEKKRFDFKSTTVQFTLKTFGNEYTETGVTPSLLVNNAEFYYSPQAASCRNNTINLVAFDRSTVIPYTAVTFDFSNSFGRACGREPQIINSFTANEVDTGNADDLIQYISNLKQSDSVLIFTVGDPDFASWSSAVKEKFQEIGVSLSDIDSFEPGEPIIILARKTGGAASAKIIRSAEADPKAELLEVNEELTGYATQGNIRSVMIGPALKWHQMSPSVKLPDASDEAGVDIYLIDKNGVETLYAFQQQAALDIGTVDAGQFPFMRLIYRTKDEDNLTPAVLKNWLVAYDPAPDGLLIPASAITPVSLPEGVDVTTDFAFVNISNIDFTDSLESVFTILNRNARIKESHEFRIKGPAVGDTTYFSQSVNTLKKVGLNDLSVAVNTGSVPEQYLQNNSIELSSYLRVNKDQRNPILEVTIDGRFVNDGDFVSTRPTIRISLRDDNKLLKIKDTTSLVLNMSYPCGSDKCAPKLIPFSRSDVSWSVSEDGNLVVIFKPTLDEGEYKLYANGFDASQNPSGADQYKVSFVVDKEPGLIFYSPYPNPSPVGFYFEFTAAGEQSPDSFALTIIDRTGHDVAHFTEQNAPPLRVGLNQLHWTSLDAQGNRLSDGLYFYQLTVRTGGSEYKNAGRIMIIR